MADTIYGWTAVPRSQKDLLSSVEWSETAPVTVAQLSLPNSALAKEVYDYAKAELPEETFNHSMRVFYYGTAIFVCRLWTLALACETPVSRILKTPR